MSIITHLQFGDNVSGLYNKDYLVVETKIHFFRNDDGFNPSSMARCSSVELTVVAPSKKDLFFQDWFFNKLSYNGRIVYELSDTALTGDLTKERCFMFDSAKCISFTERYDIDSSSLRYFDIKLILEECEIDGIQFHNGSF